MPDYSALERSLDYQFKQTPLLVQALTHRSFASHNNERLEFLGDGVLNFVIAHMIYQNFPKLDEGEMSRLRALLVKESSLCELALTLNLGDYLILGEGELKSGGWQRPSVLADAVEAIFAAIFLDAGYQAVEKVTQHLFAQRMANINPQSVNKDAKTQLQEHLQARKMPLPLYQVLRTEGEAHQQTFFVECVIPPLNIRTQGHASSRRNAEQMAASLAFDKIQQGKAK